MLQQTRSSVTSGCVRAAARPASPNSSSSSCRSGLASHGLRMVRSEAACLQGGGMKIKRKVRTPSGTLSVQQKVTTFGEGSYSEHLQEDMVCRKLAPHFLITQLAAAARKNGHFMSLQADGLNLATYHGQILHRCDDSLPPNYVPAVVRELATSMVTALQHLAANDPVTTLRYVKLTNFGSSCIDGTALAPRAKDLAMVPPEKRHPDWLAFDDFINHVSYEFDMWGMGVTLLDLLSPEGRPKVLLASTYGIKGQLSDPENRGALFEALAAMDGQCSNLWSWVEANYPPETMEMLRVNPLLKDFIGRCLAPDPKQRMTPGQAALHPLISEYHRCILPGVCKRLAKEQKEENPRIYGVAKFIFKETLSELRAAAAAAAAAEEALDFTFATSPGSGDDYPTPRFWPAGTMCTSSSAGGVSLVLCNQLEVSSTVAGQAGKPTPPKLDLLAGAGQLGVLETEASPVAGESGVSSADSPTFGVSTPAADGEPRLRQGSSGSGSSSPTMRSSQVLADAAGALTRAGGVAASKAAGAVRAAAGRCVRKLQGLARLAGAAASQGRSRGSVTRRSSSRCSSSSRATSILATSKVPVCCKAPCLDVLDIKHTKLAAEECSSAGELLAECHRATGGMPYPMLLVTYSSTLV